MMSMSSLDSKQVLLSLQRRYKSEVALDDWNSSHKFKRIWPKHNDDIQCRSMGLQLKCQKKCQVSGPKEGAVKLHRDAPKGRRHAMVQHPPPVRPSLLHSRKAYLVLSTKDANNARSQFQCNYSKSNKSLAEQATGGLLQLPLDPAQQPEQLAPTGVSTQEAKSTF